jgi:hypothetical protein
MGGFTFILRNSLYFSWRTDPARTDVRGCNLTFSVHSLVFTAGHAIADKELHFHRAETPPAALDRCTTYFSLLQVHSQ